MGAWIAACEARCTRRSVSGGATSWTSLIRDVSIDPNAGWSTSASVTGGNVDLIIVGASARICSSPASAVKCVRQR